jgi:hypothetical protein
MGTRKSIPTPSAERLRELFTYDAESGVLRYRKGVKGAGKFAGDEAGYVCPTNGYRMVGVNYKRYLTHRLIWKIVTGEDARNGVDHIDGTKLNNRFANLREANQSQNGANSKLGKGNRSGVKGVFWWARVGKWQARIMLNRKTYDLGRYDCLEDAAAAVSVARDRFHGEFARAA